MQPLHWSFIKAMAASGFGKPGKNKAPMCPCRDQSGVQCHDLPGTGIDLTGSTGNKEKADTQTQAQESSGQVGHAR